jgi:hypothetical protein
VTHLSLIRELVVDGLSSPIPRSFSFVDIANKFCRIEEWETALFLVQRLLRR